MCRLNNQQIRHTRKQTDPLSERFDTVIVPVFCACMIAAQGLFHGIHTGNLKMQYQVKEETEFIQKRMDAVFPVQTSNVRIKKNH